MMFLRHSTVAMCCNRLLVNLIQSANAVLLPVSLCGWALFLLWLQRLLHPSLQVSEVLSAHSEGIDMETLHPTESSSIFQIVN